jgi:predicted CoA-binding protein
LKSYAYLDQAPVQAVDLHEGLDNTLVMLRSKLKAGVNVRRLYGPALPRIQAYGSELNQVWTNLIDNAIDAMQGSGEITIRTHQDGPWVVVEIEDSGPGIPESIQPKIFDPFFTTKPPGKGTGLGLNISYNVIVHKHKGQINLSSRPGKTIFQVRLPINFAESDHNATPVPLVGKPDDEKLRQILLTTKTIAVVGISSREEQPAFTVPAYLQKAGYRIVPVNPRLEAALGEKAFASLPAIQEPVDTVLVFRRSEFVPAVVEEAIQIGARTIWTQEGIINESAAITAQAAGLVVVMDTCMRASHRRLIESRSRP